ncbi:cholinesterase 2-like isoform X2 [Harmonia axyridis]|nr:cholinesterase 2-like isoform X2 [Harmonia axyridis]
MVFIHGGGYINGNSDINIYGPDLLISEDVLVVTLNYRLGVFGFLSTEDLASPGNYGLKDQNLALRWIKKNIKYFGGDPNNVLLFGQSAGSSSVHFHMLSSKSQGLFHKVILESGSALCQWSSQRKPRNLAYLVGIANGITNPKDSGELVNKLRQIDLEDMKQTLLGILIVSITQGLITGLPFAPSLEVDHEDAFLTKNNWYEMLKNGNFSHVPVVMGINSNEALYFYEEASILQPLLVLLDLDVSLLTPPAMNITDRELSTSVGALIRDRYFGQNNRISTSDVLDLIRYFTEDQFMRPICKTAELMSKYIPLYFYHFRFESQFGRNALPGRSFPVGLHGVVHAEELLFLFDTLNNVSKKEADYNVRERMIRMWTNFAKYSNPTPSIGNIELGNIVWPTFKSRNNYQTEYLDIDERLKIRIDFDDFKNVLWWNELFNKYGNPPYHIY